MGGSGTLLAGGVMPALTLLAKAALILGMAWTLARIAHASSAAVRHAIWASALLAVVVLPPLAPARCSRCDWRRGMRGSIPTIPTSAVSG